MIPPQAILFDLFDTLVGCDWSKMIRLLAAALEVDELRLARVYDEMTELRDGGEYQTSAAVLTAVAGRCGGDIEPGRINDLVREEESLLAEISYLYDDAVPVLAELRGRGVATAIVSNCSPNALPIIESFELAEQVDSVVLSFQVGHAKPEPEIFSRVLADLESGPGNAWLVDDRSDYLDGAAAMGMSTFLIDRTTSRTAPESIHRALGSLAELVNLVER